MEHENVKRFAITHLNKDGLRELAFANQGRNHYETREAAEKALAEYAPQLQSVLNLKALEVREIECYWHGDAISRYIETDFKPVTGHPFTATCTSCGQTFLTGDGERLTEMYADTTGTPWKAYYCEPCASAALKLQGVRRA